MSEILPHEITSADSDLLRQINRCKAITYLMGIFSRLQMFASLFASMIIANIFFIFKAAYRENCRDALTDHREAGT
jgi:hypothetical protein